MTTCDVLHALSILFSYYIIIFLDLLHTDIKKWRQTKQWNMYVI